VDSNDLREITRTWERQRLSVLERSPALYQDIRAGIQEGSRAEVILNLIDAALDETPSPATIASAATSAFDQMRALVTNEEREVFLELLGKVNRHEAKPIELKSVLLTFAVRHHATAMLEGTYFDEVRVFAAG
jgi:hypothetical protein